MEPKKTRGRQKIVMKKMLNRRHCLVTFSKRRSGLYKKSSEISILSGAEVASVIFSPAGNPFVYCTTSSVDATMEKLFRPSPHPIEYDDTSLRNAMPDAKINKITELFNALREQDEAQNEYFKQLKERREKERPINSWWDADLNKLSLPELEQTCSWFADLKLAISDQLQKRTGVASSSSLLTPTTADLFKR